jgi:putative redox protein
MKITFKRLDNAFHILASNEHGNTIQTDGSTQIGGNHLGMRPMQVVLSALGSCSAIDVIQFLKKMRQPLRDIEMIVTAEREKEKTPSLFTDIHIHYILKGKLNSKKVERAISMSVDKYCSVARILEHTANITWDYKIEYEE